MNMIPVNRKFLRGDIYYANLEPHLGSEQGGIRPVVVVQSNTANCYSPNLIVAPVTSNTAKKPVTKPTFLWTVIGLFCSPYDFGRICPDHQQGTADPPDGAVEHPGTHSAHYALLYQLDLNEWVWRKEAYERYLRYHR